MTDRLIVRGGYGYPFMRLGSFHDDLRLIYNFQIVKIVCFFLVCIPTQFYTTASSLHPVIETVICIQAI